MKRSPPTVEHGQQIDYNFKLKSIEKFSNKCGNVERVRVLSKSATKNDALNAETKEKKLFIPVSLRMRQDTKRAWVFHATRLKEWNSSCNFSICKGNSGSFPIIRWKRSSICWGKGPPSSVDLRWDKYCFQHFIQRWKSSVRCKMRIMFLLLIL